MKKKEIVTLVLTATLLMTVHTVHASVAENAPVQKLNLYWHIQHNVLFL